MNNILLGLGCLLGYFTLIVIVCAVACLGYAYPILGLFLITASILALSWLIGDIINKVKS